MSYNRFAIERRICLGIKADGTPCRAWAVWDDPRQLCFCHAGRHHTGPIVKRIRPKKTNGYISCECGAYAWPHRPGGGLCIWPLPPFIRSRIPAGTHREIRRPKSLRRSF